MKINIFFKIFIIIIHLFIFVLNVFKHFFIRCECNIMVIMTFDEKLLSFRGLIGESMYDVVRTKLTCF